jgi:hypothetical protein
MILVCPKCLLKVKIEDSKVPKAGAWAACPKCSERFFIPGFDLKTILDEQKPSAPLLSSAGPKKLPDLEKFIPSETLSLAKSPQPIYKRHLTAFFVILCCAATLVALVFFYRASYDVPDNLPASPTQVSISVYGTEQLRLDLRYLKRNLAPYNRVHRLIGFKSPESRVLKYLQKEMNINTCEQIVSINLDSEKPSDYFVLKANCLDSWEEGVQLEFNFLGGWVVVQEVASQARMDIPLMPSALKAWEAGQHQASALGVSEQ